MIFENFKKSYLDESPQRLDSSGSAYYSLAPLVSELASIVNVTVLGDNMFSLRDGDTVYYWVGSKDGQTVDLVTSIDVVTNGVAVVDLTAKNPELSKGPPYASDLLVKAADNLGKAIRFTGSKILSTDGMKMWYNLFKNNHVISVYDNKSDQYAVNNVTSIEELERYWKDHPEYQRYQYVLSESHSAVFIRGDFTLTEWKRLSGWPLV